MRAVESFPQDTDLPGFRASLCWRLMESLWSSMFMNGPKKQKTWKKSGWPQTAGKSFSSVKNSRSPLSLPRIPTAVPPTGSRKLPGRSRLISMCRSMGMSP